jgi:hypothetical protein
MVENIPDGTHEGLSRRDMLRRSALVGGTVVWMAPAVQTLAAPAFANGSTSEENPPEGAISYVIVFFNCGGTYYRVKYSGTTSGYTLACGDDASSGNVSDDEGGVGVTYYNTILSENSLTDASFSDDCPTGASASTTADGSLQLTLSGCSIIGWLLHDGSCQAVDGTTKFRYDSKNTELDAQTSGPEVPTSVGGVFIFDDCK